jgi:hypothetical protein
MPATTTRVTPPTLTARKRKVHRSARLKEDGLIAAANTARFLVERGWRSSLSDFPKYSRQSDPLVDRAALEFLDRKLAKGGHFGLTASPACLVRLRPASELVKLKRWGAKHTLSRKARHALTPTFSPTGAKPAYLIHVNNWDHASEVWKLVSYISCIPVGERLTFNLDLTPQIALRAIQSQEGPAMFLQDRIASQLRRTFNPNSSPAFAMQLETAEPWEGSRRAPVPAGLHVHGVIERPRRAQDLKALKRALINVSGESNKKQRPRMLKLKSCLNPIGWATYIYKRRLQTSAALYDARLTLTHIPICKLTEKQPVLAASARLRSRAQAWYKAQREDETLTWISPKKGIARTTY